MQAPLQNESVTGQRPYNCILPNALEIFARDFIRCAAVEHIVICETKTVGLGALFLA